MDRFNAKKKSIIGNLSLAPATYTDLSPKGSVDEEIKAVVDEINSQPGYVTTSSCAGRISIYLEGVRRNRLEDFAFQGDSAQDTPRAGATSGGKGGGRWLFVSHQSIDVNELVDDRAVLTCLGLGGANLMRVGPIDGQLPLIHFKFEPMILHVLTASVEHAQHALNAAMTAGFRESGISSVLDSKGRTSQPLVAVRSAGLSFDSIIGFASPGTLGVRQDDIHLLVSESHLRMLLQIAKERFKVNAERKSRFCQEFLSRKSVPTRGRSRGNRKVSRRRNDEQQIIDSSFTNEQSTGPWHDRQADADSATAAEDHAADILVDDDGLGGSISGLFGPVLEDDVCQSAPPQS